MARPGRVLRTPEAHAAHIRARVPLYSKAAAELRALELHMAGAAHRVGVDLPWPAAFAPLTLEEKRTVRSAFLEKLEARRAVQAQVAAAVDGASS